MKDPSEVWIGMAHVIPRIGSTVLGDAPGAWVTVLAWATDSASYRSLVYAAAAHYELALESLEDIESLSARSRRLTLDRTLLKLAKEVEVTHGLRFGAFHTYPPNLT